jgi:carboxypeptidase PM20D1
MFKGQTVFAVSVAEKGVLWLRLTVPGVGGHGSTPRVEHTPQRLLEVVERLRRRRAAVHIDPSLYELVARVGAHHGGLGGFVLQRPALVDTFMHGRLLGHPATRAAITDTVALTGLACDGGAPNVIPSSATLVLDCRLLPGTRPAAVVAELGRLVGDDPKVRFEVLAAVPARGNPWDDPFYRALARHVVAGRTDAVAGPALSVGFTDSIFAREQGTRAYGLVPFDLEQAEAATMHGVGERVSVANVTRGLKVLFSAVVEVAADLAGAGPRGGVARPPARPLPPPPVELPAASTRPPPASRFAAPGSRE